MQGSQSNSMLVPPPPLATKDPELIALVQAVQRNHKVETITKEERDVQRQIGFIDKLISKRQSVNPHPIVGTQREK